jgi:hypothetical protein
VSIETKDALPVRLIAREVLGLDHQLPSHWIIWYPVFHYGFKLIEEITPDQACRMRPAKEPALIAARRDPPRFWYAVERLTERPSAWPGESLFSSI